MKRRLCWSSSALLALALVASAQSGSANRDMGARNPDHHFVVDAAQGGMAEVELGNLAQQKASSDSVKQFGRRMVDDHTKANNELKSLAGQKSITLPTDMGAKNQAMYDRLAKLSGAEFDREYVRHMVMDHKKDVGEFQKEASSGQDSDVKAWAAKTVPTLQDHLSQIQQIQSSMGAGSSNAHHQQ